MDTRFQSKKKLLKVLGLIMVCVLNLSSTHAVVSVFADTSEKIVFTLDDGQRDIYMMDPDGNNLINITNTPSLSEVFPRWSPDAKRISFSCDGDIWVMNNDGSNCINLTQSSGFYEEPHSWSPDGSKIVYSRRMGMGFDRRIYVMNSDGTNYIELTSGYADEHPCWSPDGSRISFDRYMTPGQPTTHSQIHIMNTDGTNVHRITYNNDDDFGPAWSPDGTQIVFASSRGGNLYRYQLYVGEFSIGSDGVPELLNQVNITNNQWRHECPRWSPDGNQIVYCRAPYGTVDHDIWISNSDGNFAVPLTNTPGIYDVYPDWITVLVIADVDIDPDTLNLRSNDKWITCYIELPEGYDVMDIDGSTVMLDGIPAYIGKEGWARAGANTANIVDHDGDSIPERMVKFDKTEVQDYLTGLLGSIELMITGDLIGSPPFEGTDTIKVIDKGGN